MDFCSRFSRVFTRSYHKVSQGITQYHKVTQGIVRYRKVSRSITKYHTVLPGITQYHKGITEYHKYRNRGGWTAARKASWSKIHFHSVELNCQRVRISDLRAMDAILEVSAIAELFQNNSRIYLYCCDFCYTFTFTVPSLPFLKINGIFAQLSFFDSLLERQMCILPLSRERNSKLEGHKFPVVADVKSSVVFEVCFCLCCFYFFCNLIEQPKGLKFIKNIDICHSAISHVCQASHIVKL